MRPPTPPLKLSPGQYDVLEILSRSGRAEHREVLTAKALLMAHEGLARSPTRPRLHLWWHRGPGNRPKRAGRRAGRPFIPIALCVDLVSFTWLRGCDEDAYP